MNSISRSMHPQIQQFHLVLLLPLLRQSRSTCLEVPGYLGRKQFSLVLIGESLGKAAVAPAVADLGNLGAMPKNGNKISLPYPFQKFT